ncbi:cytochrome P450 [Rhizophagus irregularis DAOM 181602=DAOM 197198]|nr:cytochrome P450 [Rhizophagus irregularis DAOM 181602=DAOM 197198]
MTTMATSYPYGFDVLKSELALSFALIASRGVVSLPSDNVEASVVVDEPDWSRIFEERFKMQISNSRREKTYTMYSNENEHVGEQLLEDQRKRTRDEPIISDTKKAKPFNVSFDEYVDSYENDRIEIFDYPEILDTDPSERFELAKQSIWCIGDRTVLEPVAERCLQSLAKLNNEQIRMIGEMNDYLDKEVGYILELVRYTCEMLGKGIPQRKNSENDIDMFIKRHIFACFDDILDTHFGEMVFRSSRDRRSEATDAPIKLKGFTQTCCLRDLILEKIYHMADSLYVLKTLRDMHRSLVKAIAIESGGALSKQVLNACINYAWFRIIVVLPSCCPYIYVGGGFYASFELEKFDIPTSYDEIWKPTKIARIMLQISQFKRIIERDEKEKFLPRKVTIIKAKESRTPNKPKKKRKNQSLKYDVLMIITYDDLLKSVYGIISTVVYKYYYRSLTKRFFDRILDAIAGGTDTIANSISSSVHYPDIKQRLRKELDEIFYKTIINKDLDRLQYCDAVVKKVYCHTPVDSTN